MFKQDHLVPVNSIVWDYPRQQHSIRQQIDAKITSVARATPGRVKNAVFVIVFMIGYKHRYFYIVYQIHRIYI